MKFWENYYILNVTFYWNQQNVFTSNYLYQTIWINRDSLITSLTLYYLTHFVSYKQLKSFSKKSSPERCKYKNYRYLASFEKIWPKGRYPGYLFTVDLNKKKKLRSKYHLIRYTKIFGAEFNLSTANIPYFAYLLPCLSLCILLKNFSRQKLFLKSLTKE